MLKSFEKAKGFTGSAGGRGQRSFFHKNYGERDFSRFFRIYVFEGPVIFSGGGKDRF